MFTDIPVFALLLPLLAGWLLDTLLGDPAWLPHPVVGFGKMIAFGEHHLNRGNHRRLKGGLLAVGLILFVFAATWFLHEALYSLFNAHQSPLTNHHSPITTRHLPFLLFDTVIVFFCLAGTTLIREVRAVFLALDHSLDDGRRQVARIVGRDTQELSAQEVRTAALETLAENLSDGVIAPLFWLLLLGTPGMLAYKMVNTLDSMIGYRTERYRLFGCVAARIDDAANYIPARLTALLMLISEKCRADSSVECREDSVEFATAHESVECREDSSVECRVDSSLECRVDSVEFATAHDTSADGSAVANSKLYTLNSTLKGTAVANSKLNTLNSTLNGSAVANSKPYTLNSTLRDSSLYTLNSKLKFVKKYGRNHASPNSGYPEAALAAILNCRFGGPHYYFGQLFPKPYIGENDRELTTEDMKTAVRVNSRAEVLMISLTVSAFLSYSFLCG